MLTTPKRLCLGAMFLITGAALVGHLLVGLPLNLAVAAGLLVVVGSLLAVGGTGVGAWLRPLVVAGLLVGMLATLAYDLSRLAVVEFTGSPTSPFEAWRLFGIALIGPGAPATAHWAVGTAFHLTNGLLFAVAYTVWLGDRGVGWGIGYALCLEACMLGLYPGWLQIRDYAEFVQVSVIGHVVYGTVLGLSAQRMVTQLRAAGPARR